MADPGRREFLKKTSAGIISGVAATNQTTADAVVPLTKRELATDVSQRQTPPDDGKKYGWLIDTRRCFGCHGCEVSCKSENDVPLGNYIRQTIYKDVGDFPKVARMFLPMSCQHCEDAPCLKACPTGAISKGVGGSVLIDYSVCDGSGECINACPYGAIYMDPVADKAVKCHNCHHRLENDMEPACASTCPADAIYFGDLNDPQSKVSKAMAEADSGQLPLVQLRADKGTKPRMWFVGPAPAEIISVGPSVWPDSMSLRINQRYIQHRVRRAVRERVTDAQYADAMCKTLGI